MTSEDCYDSQAHIRDLIFEHLVIHGYLHTADAFSRSAGDRPRDGSLTLAGFELLQCGLRAYIGTDEAACKDARITERIHRQQVLEAIRMQKYGLAIDLARRYELSGDKDVLRVLGLPHEQAVADPCLSGEHARRLDWDVKRARVLGHLGKPRSTLQAMWAVARTLGGDVGENSAKTKL